MMEFENCAINRICTKQITVRYVNSEMECIYRDVFDYKITEAAGFGLLKLCRYNDLREVETVYFPLCSIAKFSVVEGRVLDASRNPVEGVNDCDSSNN